MSQTDRLDPGQSNFERAKAYGELQPASGFEARTKQILGDIKSYGVEHGRTRKEAIEDATSKYFRQEPDSGLRQLADVLLTAPLAVDGQRRLDKVREIIKAKGETPQRQQVLGVYWEGITTYNHKVRSLIGEIVRVDDQSFRRQDLENAMETAGGAAAGWARKLVSGMRGEVAPAGVFESMPEISSWRFSTVPEERRHIDVVVGLPGGGMNIDFKTGGNRGLDEVVVRGRNAEIAIDNNWIDPEGFTLLPEHRQNVAGLVREAASMMPRSSAA